VTNLGKVFWPEGRDGRRARPFTKGDLLRHYTRVAPVILPVLADRPLVMKRHPNGVSAQAFYQHKVTPPLPPGVRVETVEHEERPKPQLVGGSLVTLLYTAQLAAISQDPWFSRLQSLDAADYVAIDLDPPDGLPFAKVRDVALWVNEVLDSMGARGFAKTSGANGLHVYVPLAPGTPYEAGLLFAQIVATQVAHRHPKAATVERTVKSRGSRVYVDYLQNIRGKTLASAYSARASHFAGVSTPLRWEEVDAKISPEDFTLATFPTRLKEVGDLWADTRSAPGADLRRITSRRR
jgi:bifunctional non-homologous end joining protein LigD